jgi:hypothetical protein
MAFRSPYCGLSLRCPCNDSCCSKNTIELAPRERDEHFSVSASGQQEASARQDLDNLVAAVVSSQNSLSDENEEGGDSLPSRGERARLTLNHRLGDIQLDIRNRADTGRNSASRRVCC